MFRFLTNIIFPHASLTLQPGVWLTEDERRILRAHPLLLEGARLLHAGVPSVRQLVAGASYNDSPLLREAIRRLKYRRVSVYGDVLGLMIAETARFLPDWPPPVLCPVPLHWSRQFFRGFNQSDILAEYVAKERGWKVERLLQRVRPTGSQAHRKRDERRRALARAFHFCGTRVPTRVVLIDDVVTTGATLDACATALRDAGVSRVDAVTLAVTLS